MTTEAEQFKELTDSIGKDMEEYKSAHKQLVESMKTNGEESAEYKAKLEAIETNLGDAEVKRQELARRLDKMDAVLETKGAAGEGGTETKAKAAEVEHKAKWDHWVRTGNGEDDMNTAAEALFEAKGMGTEYKAMTNASATGGGNLVPEEVSTDILRRAIQSSPLASIVRNRQVSTSDYHELVANGIAGGWVGEADPRSETGTAAFNRRTPTHGEVYALPKVSNWNLNDAFFNVEEHLREEGNITMSQLIGSAIMSGDGTDKPTGILNGTPVPTADFGARAVGVLQYIPTGDAALITADSLFDLVFGLHSQFTTNATAVMNRATFATVRKLKSTTNEYLVDPGLNGQGTATLVGYPVVIADHAPDIAANDFPILFGDFNQGYVYVRIQGMTMTRDPYTEKGHTLFYMSQRVGGIIRNDEAIKVLKVAVS